MATRKEDKNTEAEAQMNDTPAQTTAVAGHPTHAVGQLDIDSLDIRNLPIPQLRITYGVGNLSEFFNPGDLILGDDSLLVKKLEGLEIIVYDLHPYWKEYLAFGAEGFPNTFDTKAEVAEAGGTTEWANNVGPTYSPAVTIKMLIKKPEGIVSGMFSMALADGAEYAPAIMYLDKSAYKKTGESLVSTCIHSLKGNMLAGKFEISTYSTKSRSGNMVIVPKIKLLVERNSYEMQTSIKSLLGG
jgi:hypothetical protein